MCFVSLFTFNRFIIFRFDTAVLSGGVRVRGEKVMRRVGISFGQRGRGNERKEKGREGKGE